MGELFFVVEDFLGDAEGDADASAVELFFVVEAFSVVVDFFAVAPLLVVDAWCVVVAAFEVAFVSFFWAQEAKNATAARIVIKDKTDLFIGCG